MISSSPVVGPINWELTYREQGYLVIIKCQDRMRSQEGCIPTLLEAGWMISVRMCSSSRCRGVRFLFVGRARVIPQKGQKCRMEYPTFPNLVSI